MVDQQKRTETSWNSAHAITVAKTIKNVISLLSLMHSRDSSHVLLYNDRLCIPE